MVLIYLCVHGADLALTEGVIECVIDGGGRDTQSRRGDAVNHERDGQAS